MAVNGTYILEKNENLEGFLKGLGLKEETISRFSAAKPTITLNLTSSSLEITTKSAEEHKNVLTLGSPSKYTLVSGFELEVSVTFTGNTGKGSLKKGDKTGDFTLEFTDAGVTEIFNVGGNVCKRIYKRT